MTLEKPTNCVLDPVVVSKLRQQRIGVLCGGRSPERAGSLVSGRTAAAALTQLGFDVVTIDPAVSGLDVALGSVDLVVVALHGLGGEDGKVQGHLETLGIPYSGSGVLASAVGLHKPTFKTLLRGANIDTPGFLVLYEGTSPARGVQRILSTMGLPVVVKPTSGGGSLGCAIARDASSLTAGLEASLHGNYSEVMVEEFVAGTDVSIAVLDVGTIVTLPALEIRSRRDFYDYIAKHDPDQRQYFCPARLSASVSARMARTARRVHDLLGGHGLSRTDAIVTPDGRCRVLEINTAPGLSAAGNLATMAAAAGIDYPQLVVAIACSALTKPAYVP